jgi:hypothetical protein
MTKNVKKNYSWKKFIILNKKIAVYLYLSLHKHCPSYRRSLSSLQPSKENIQPFKHELS